MDEPVVKMTWSDGHRDPAALLTREWLVANGLGGYAAGTVAGVATRRYHSLLVAALPAPYGRQVMFNHLSELVRLPGGETALIGGVETPEQNWRAPGSECLREFRLDDGLPVWRYEVAGFAFEKRVLLPHLQNTALVAYRLIAGEGTLRLKLRPALHFRPHEAPVSDMLGPRYRVHWQDDRCDVRADDGFPPLRLCVIGQRAALTLAGQYLRDVVYRIERSRGYEAVGTLWSPGYFRVDLSPGEDATLVATMESWEHALALSPQASFEAERARRQRLIAAAHPEVQAGPARELVLAADQFVIAPAARVEDAARAHAAGDEARSVIAGYHWFTDWGRDTMIGLEGLALTTGRAAEAGQILRTFAQHVRDGLIPNLFPEGENQGLYHTADASLWFFQAVHRYLVATDDRATLRLLLPKLLEIAERHLAGTRFGIGVDPADGLLRQGAEGYQLTWMDAKVGDWVVTPRRGKAVEINALWHNALRLLAGWLEEEGQSAIARSWSDQADRARESFQRRFWYSRGGYLYDVVDGEQGDDAACRPNQVFAISLPHPILDPARWAAVLAVVEERLLTPVGLRSLSRDHPDYKPTYDGDLRARDAAYHQGTVWSWLIGPFVDAWRKVHPGDPAGARRFLTGLADTLHEACLGSISEIFDAEEPFTPRGCVAQAWSVAELLRCWAATAEGTEIGNAAQLQRAAA